jgi:hypothetical protein
MATDYDHKEIITLTDCVQNSVFPEAGIIHVVQIHCNKKE